MVMRRSHVFWGKRWNLFVVGILVIAIVLFAFFWIQNRNALVAGAQCSIGTITVSAQGIGVGTSEQGGQWDSESNCLVNLLSNETAQCTSFCANQSCELHDTSISGAFTFSGPYCSPEAGGFICTTSCSQSVKCVCWEKANVPAPNPTTGPGRGRGGLA